MPERIDPDRTIDYKGYRIHHDTDQAPLEIINELLQLTQTVHGSGRRFRQMTQHPGEEILTFNEVDTFFATQEEMMKLIDNMRGNCQ